MNCPACGYTEAAVRDAVRRLAGGYTKVELWAVDDLFGVIIPALTGIIWSNQVGGTACDHPEVEGIFVPLLGKGALGERNDPLFEHWKEPPTSPLIERWIAAHGFSASFQTPRKADLVEMAADYPDLPPSAFAAEAWVPLIIKTGRDFPQQLAPFVGKLCFATYGNSD
jgi:hypothetical protein